MALLYPTQLFNKIYYIAENLQVQKFHCFMLKSYTVEANLLPTFFMFVLCINSIKTLFYYSKLMHTIIKS